MLELRHLTKVYGKNGKTAVEDVSFTVRAGEIFGFLGANGAGKTTTIKMIAGLLEPTSGSINLKGLDRVKDDQQFKKIISYVPDQPFVYEHIKGIRYLEFIADAYGIDSKTGLKRIKKYAKVFNMEEALQDVIGTYSLGMRQKIVLIGSLLHDAEILILDEPMSGLDPKASHALKQIMKKLCAEGKSIFFSSHVLEVVEKICHRIGIIDKGKLIAVGSLDELKQRPGEESLEDLFLELTEK